MKISEKILLLVFISNLQFECFCNESEVQRRIQAAQSFWKTFIAKASTPSFESTIPHKPNHLSAPAPEIVSVLEKSHAVTCGVRSSSYLPHIPVKEQGDKPRSRQARIVWSDSAYETMGTLPAPSGTFPWMASLFVLLRGTGEALFMCAGSILTPNLIVTAAHCFTNNDDEDTWFARVGDNFILSPDKDEQTFRVKRILKHDDFDPLRTDRSNSDGGDGRHDIALVILQPHKLVGRNQFGLADPSNGFIRFSEDVRPICLLSQSDYPIQKLIDHHCEIAGWGMTEYNNTGSYPDSVRAARISVGDLPDYYCNYLYRRDVKITGKFCAGGSVDACQEDSGGPLVCRMDNNRYHLVGIVSSGKGCGVYPGLYTDVSKYMDWLVYWILKESI